MIFVRDDMKDLFPEKSLDEFFQIDGETVKHVVASRRIFRFERGGKNFYMKVHFGVGWREIFKNWLQLKAPILGAEKEWLAIQAFHRREIDIETMEIVAYGKQGTNPATQRSFLITDALEQTIDLEQWLPPLTYRPLKPERLKLKRAIIRRVAEIGSRLHDNDMCHRDFYLCHFRIDISDADPLPDPENMHIYLMDLHRVGIDANIKPRWRVKDIAGLLYSALFDAKDLTLTQTDILRFMSAYTGKICRPAISDHQDFWLAVLKRVYHTYQKDHGVPPPWPNYLQAWYLGNDIAV